MKYIDTLKEGMKIANVVYLCKSKQINTTKNGKEYGSVLLQDKTGIVDAKIWDLDSMAIEDFDTLDYVSIDADVNVFNEKIQLIIRRIKRAKEDEYIISDYIPVTKKDISKLKKDLEEKIASIKDEFYRQILEEVFLKDQDFYKKFCFSSAAKTVHHSYVGGLLEHTISVANLCEFLALNYEIINRDLLLSAALLHDIGKTRELSSFPENDYTDEGHLLGHIVIAVGIISEKIRNIKQIERKKFDELIHCILAHHGELEYGSPKKPALVEAFALNFADNTDAKLTTVTSYLESAKESSSWIGFNKFLDTNMRKTT